MGQTDEAHYHVDADGHEYWERLFCPHCGHELGGGYWLGVLDSEDVVGCDDCGQDVTVADVEIRWVRDETGDQYA